MLDEHGEYCWDSSVPSNGHIITATDSRTCEYYVGGKYEFKDPVCKPESVVYLGFLYNHWGHFLIDFSSRLWYTRECDLETTTFVFIVEDGSKFTPIKQISDFFEFLGIKRVVFVNIPTKYSEVIVPEPAYVTNLYYSQKHLDVFEYVANQVMKTGDDISYPQKVYFTRTAYKKAKTTEIGEDSLKECFASNGFEIVSPEQNSLARQIRYIRNAEIVAGIAGTIPHNMIFAKQGQSVVILNKTYIVNMMQRDINIMRHLNVTFIDSYECVEARSLGGGPFLLCCNNNFDIYCRDHAYNVLNISDSYEKDNVKKYLDMISMSPVYNPPVIHQEESVHYFDPEFANAFNQKYLRLFYKPSFKLVLKNNIIQILKRAKRAFKH